MTSVIFSTFPRLLSAKFKLVTNLIYSTFDEQYELIEYSLENAIRKNYFLNLNSNEKLLFESITNENLFFVNKQNISQELNLSQKQILFYRRRLLEEKRKLKFIDYFINQTHLFSEYHSNLFQTFRYLNYFQIGKRCARVSFFFSINYYFQLNHFKIKDW